MRYIMMVCIFVCFGCQQSEQKKVKEKQERADKQKMKKGEEKKAIPKKHDSKSARLQKIYEKGIADYNKRLKEFKERKKVLGLLPKALEKIAKEKKKLHDAIILEGKELQAEDISQEQKNELKMSIEQKKKKLQDQQEEELIIKINQKRIAREENNLANDLKKLEKLKEKINKLKESE